MPHRILWVEEDYMHAVEAAIRREGYDLDRAYSLCEADRRIASQVYDLILLDIMMPLEREDISAGYNATITNDGANAGVAFYQKHCKLILQMKAKVLVFSVRADEPELKSELRALDFNMRNFLSKQTFSNVRALRAEIKRVLSE